MPRSTRKPAATPPAEKFRRSRRDRAAETAQDYVEAIADLSAALGEADVVIVQPTWSPVVRNLLEVLLILAESGAAPLRQGALTI